MNSSNLVPIRPEGAEAPSQGNTLGISAISLAPCKGKSFQITIIQVQYFLTSFFNLITPFDTKLIFSHENTKEKAKKTAKYLEVTRILLIFAEEKLHSAI